MALPDNGLFGAIAGKNPYPPTISGLHETPFTRLQSNIRRSVTNGIVAHGAMLKRESSHWRWN